MAPLSFLGKFLQVSGVFLLMGGGLAGPWVMEPLADGSQRHTAGRRPMAGIVMVGASLVLVGLLVTAATTAAMVQRQPGLGAALQTMATVITRTSVGRLWLAGGLMAGLLLGAAVAGARTGHRGRRSPAGKAWGRGAPGGTATPYHQWGLGPLPSSLFYLLLLGVIFLQAGGGHARTGPAPWLSWAATGLHLTAAAAWGGSLWLLGLLPWARMARTPAVALAAVHELLSRMSRLGTGAVAVFLLTGSALAAWYGLRPAGLFTTAYGQSLAAKLLLFILTGATALINRWVLMPRLERMAGLGRSSARPDPSLSPWGRARLMRAVGLVLRLEAVGVILVAAATAWLTQQPPPM